MNKEIKCQNKDCSHDINEVCECECSLCRPDLWDEKKNFTKLLENKNMKKEKKWNWEVIIAMFGGYFIGAAGNSGGWEQFICLFIGGILLTIAILL